MPEADRRINLPWEQMPLLEWYQDVFDAAYIMLHPFCTIGGIDPAIAPRPVLVLDRVDLPPEPLTQQMITDVSNKYHEAFQIYLQELQTQEKKIGEALSWKRIRDACDFNSKSQLNRALLTVIMAVRGPSAHPGDAEYLQTHCAVNKIFMPTEDTFPPLLEDKIVATLERLGCTDVYFADEHDQNRQKVSVAALKTELPWKYSELCNFKISKIYPDDYSFLFIVPFDSFNTIVCGKREALKSLELEQLFEGFWCDRRTELDWWRQND